MKNLKRILSITLISILGSCSKKEDETIRNPENTAPGYYSEVFAGGTQGFANGVGTAAKFYTPSGITLDASGNLFVGDYVNNRIRKITPNATVTTVAGSGTIGNANGTLTAAQFDAPTVVAFRSDGTMYLADRNNGTIRLINTTNSTVSNYSGNGNFGDQIGVPSATSYKFPEGICIDNANNIYIADTDNNKIKKIDTNGNATLFAGSTTAGYNDATGSAARFDSPRGMVIDPAGTIYLADTFNNKIRKISTSGVVSTFAGTTRGFEDGSVATAKFDRPTHLALDANGNLYVSDRDNNKIRKITPSGTVSTIVFSNSVFTALTMNNPAGIAVTPNGIIYVADLRNERILKIVLKN